MTESLCMYVIGVEEDGPCAVCGTPKWDHPADYEYRPPVRRCGHPESEHQGICVDREMDRWMTRCVVCEQMGGRYHASYHHYVEAEEEARV